VKAGGFCLDTVGNATASGTGVVTDSCSTDATQKWRVTSTGTLVNAAKSTLCLTDPSASATKGTQLTLATCGGKGQTWSTITAGALPAGQTQKFTYDEESRTATVSTPSGTTARSSKYLYDADGNLLEQTASVGGTDKTRILYLFGGAEQLTLDVGAKTCTALRYYSGPDGTRVTRSSSGDVWYQVANSQGTATTSVAADDLAVTRRYYDPYGNPRGSEPSTWGSADENHGFLGKPTDSVTGLDLLGARNYDPTLGRFLTPDPLFQAGDPNQMGGYTYAADNPASGSDPTGYDNWANTSMNTCAPGFTCGSPTPSPSPAPAPTNTSSGSTNATPAAGPSPGVTPPATPPDPNVAPDLLYGTIESIGLAIRSMSVCEFWLTGGGADHDQACDIAGGVVSGGGLEGSGVRALEGGAMGEGESALVKTGRAEAGSDAAAAAGAGAKAVDEAASDAADLAVLKRANAQAKAEEADAAAVAPDTPAKGASGTKPSGRASGDRDAADEELRTAVHKRYKEITTEGSPAYQTNRARGPVLTGAMDNVSGNITFGQNTGIPSPLHPTFEDRIANFEGEPAPYKGEPGSHSEINALNEGMLARPGSTLDEFTVYNVRLKGTQKGQRIIRCDNCQQITDGVREIE
jgi:RHS repeat-associated protein